MIHSITAGNLVTDTSTVRRSLRLHVVVGLVVIAVLTFGVGGWAALAPISGAVVASGLLVVDTSTKPVQHPDGGIIAEVLVRDGDRVAAGEVLARLDNTEARSNLAIIENRIYERSAREARLIAERDGLDGIAFPQPLLDRTRETHVHELLASEGRFLVARGDLRAGQKEQLEERVIQYNSEISGFRAQKMGIERQLDLIEEELTGLRLLRVDGNVSMTRLNAVEREFASFQSQQGVIDATIARLEGQISETRLRIIEVDRQFQSEVGQELATIRADLSELAQRQVAAQEQLRRVDIRAPQAGIVHDLTVHVAGAVIGEGAPIMYIVPSDDSLVVEVRVQPQDIDQLFLGQPVRVRFSAFNQRTTPEVDGLVARVGADLSIDNVTGTSYYTVRIDIGNTELARLGELVLVPGMPVEAFIETEQRTALSYLIKPLGDQIERAFREE